MGIRFFYSASVMGYGLGRFWHKFYKLPNFPRVTKTLTYNRKIGYPFLVLKYGDSVFNHVALHNIGYRQYISEYLINFNSYWSKDNIIISLAGTNDELQEMINVLDNYESIYLFNAYELNFTCPNYCSFNNITIPQSKYHPIYLKLNYLEDPYKYDLSKIKGIRINSVPCQFGGGSGKYAQEKNWSFIKQFGKELNVAGCSVTSKDDINRLIDYGCTEIGLGAIVLTNPKFVESLFEINC